MMNHDDVGTKSYLRPIKHNRTKVNEDTFLYIFYYSSNFYHSQNKYEIPRTESQTYLDSKDKADSIYIRNKGMCPNIAKILNEKFLSVHKELVE